MSVVQLEGYQFNEKIGEGGMAEVYRGQQLSLARPVAIKILNQQMCEHGQIHEAFEREAVIIARLNHPNIVNVIDRGMTPQGTPYFIMEYVEGADLASVIRSRELSLRNKLDICLQLCKAFSYAHKNSVIHRDIKPANIIVDRDFTIKVLDFGIALFQADKSAETAHEAKPESENSFVLGTESYMAPELVNSTANASIKTDIYSLGVVMYELFAGYFPGEEERQKKPSDTALPAKLANLVMSCLAHDANQRPPSMTAVYDRLLLQSQGSHLDTQRVKRANAAVNNRKTFSLLDILWENEQGAVYLFIEKNSGQQFVVKKTIGQFHGFQTCQTMSKLSHKNIARLHGVSKNKNAFIEVMDYLKGGSLQERLVRNYSVEEFFIIAQQIVNGLSYAHKNGVIHGNLRPSNILFDEQGIVKVADFGMLHHREENDAQKSKRDSKSSRNPPAFYIESEPLCPQSDIFACGVIFYLMLVGHFPLFKGQALHQSRHFRRLPDDIQSLLAGMLNRQLTERPSSFESIAASLDQQLGDMPTLVCNSVPENRESSERSSFSHFKKVLSIGLVMVLVVAAFFIGRAM